MITCQGCGDRVTPSRFDPLSCAPCAAIGNPTPAIGCVRLGVGT